MTASDEVTIVVKDGDEYITSVTYKINHMPDKGKIEKWKTSVIEQHRLKKLKQILSLN